MKTVIYYNVNSGEAFDAYGRIRSANNPFTVAYGEKRIFEWHLVADNTVADPASWTAVSDFEFLPTIASIATDGTYVSAYKGTLISVTNGAESEIAVKTAASEDVVTSTGKIRLSLANGSEIEYDYISAAKTETGFIFRVNENLDGVAFAENTTADILKQTMAKASDFILEQSEPENGIFSFTLAFRSEKLKKIFEYSDSESFETKGLELRVAGLDSENLRVELARAVVPLTILGVLDQSNLPATLPANALTEYQTWTLTLMSAGFDVEFSVDLVNWSTESAKATYFRMRPSGIESAHWSIPIPIPQPKTDPDHVEYAFTIGASSDVGTVEIPYEDLNVAKPFDCSLFELQTDSSELNITHNSNLQMFFSKNNVKLCWNGMFPAGTYVLRG